MKILPAVHDDGAGATTVRFVHLPVEPKTNDL